MAKIRTASDNYKNVILSTKTDFTIVESYKILRTNLLFAISTTKSKTFLVSSIEPYAGKTVTSSNLAITLAQTGAKTLLLDADMRKPSQHKIFKLKNNSGLSHVLSGLKHLDCVIKKEVLHNLDVILSGYIPPNPSELLGSKNMQTFLELIEKAYDYVVIDTPPIGITTDALTIIDRTAGLLLVCRYKKTTYDMIGRAIEMTENVNGKLLGVVINDISQKKNEAYKLSNKHNYGE